MVVAALLAIPSCASPGADGKARKGAVSEWNRANLPDGHVVLTSRGASAAYDTKGKSVAVQEGVAMLISGPNKPLKVISWGLHGELSGRGELTVKKGESITAVCRTGTFTLRFPGSQKPPIKLSAGKAATVTLKKRS